MNHSNAGLQRQYHTNDDTTLMKGVAKKNTKGVAKKNTKGTEKITTRQSPIYTVIQPNNLNHVVHLNNHDCYLTSMTKAAEKTHTRQSQQRHQKKTIVLTEVQKQTAQQVFKIVIDSVLKPMSVRSKLHQHQYNRQHKVQQRTQCETKAATSVTNGGNVSYKVWYGGCSCGKSSVLPLGTFEVISRKYREEKQHQQCNSKVYKKRRTKPTVAEQEQPVFAKHSFHRLDSFRVTEVVIELLNKMFAALGKETNTAQLVEEMLNQSQVAANKMRRALKSHPLTKGNVNVTHEDNHVVIKMSNSLCLTCATCFSEYDIGMKRAYAINGLGFALARKNYLENYLDVTTTTTTTNTTKATNTTTTTTNTNTTNTTNTTNITNTTNNTNNTNNTTTINAATITQTTDPRTANTPNSNQPQLTTDCWGKKNKLLAIFSQLSAEELHELFSIHACPTATTTKDTTFASPVSITKLSKWCLKLEVDLQHVPLTEMGMTRALQNQTSHCCHYFQGPNTHVVREQACVQAVSLSANHGQTINLARNIQVGHVVLNDSSGICDKDLESLGGVPLSGNGMGYTHTSGKSHDIWSNDPPDVLMYLIASDKHYRDLIACGSTNELKMLIDFASTSLFSFASVRSAMSGQSAEELRNSILFLQASMYNMEGSQARSGNATGVMNGLGFLAGNSRDKHTTSSFVPALLLPTNSTSPNKAGTGCRLGYIRHTQVDSKNRPPLHKRPLSTTTSVIHHGGGLRQGHGKGDTGHFIDLLQGDPPSSTPTTGKHTAPSEKTSRQQKPNKSTPNDPSIDSATTFTTPTVSIFEMIDSYSKKGSTSLEVATERTRFETAMVQATGNDVDRKRCLRLVVEHHVAEWVVYALLKSMNVSLGVHSIARIETMLSSLLKMDAARLPFANVTNFYYRVLFTLCIQHDNGTWAINFASTRGHEDHIENGESALIGSIEYRVLHHHLNNLSRAHRDELLSMYESAGLNPSNSRRVLNCALEELCVEQQTSIYTPVHGFPVGMNIANSTVLASRRCCYHHYRQYADCVLVVAFSSSNYLEHSCVGTFHGTGTSLKTQINDAIQAQQAMLNPRHDTKYKERANRKKEMAMTSGARAGVQAFSRSVIEICKIALRGRESGGGDGHREGMCAGSVGCGETTAVTVAGHRRRRDNRLAEAAAAAAAPASVQRLQRLAAYHNGLAERGEARIQQRDGDANNHNGANAAAPIQGFGNIGDAVPPSGDY